MTRVLVAGIGNVFFGDDGFGVEVARQLSLRPIPDGVAVVDFGIRGFDLACAIAGGCETAILVDAGPRGKAPGTLTVLDASDAAGEPSLEPHALDPARVLALSQQLGGRAKRLRVVVCEPESLGTEDEVVVGLSACVGAAVGRAVTLVDGLVREALDGGVS
jgi:hydrogenase maturation protease